MFNFHFPVLHASNESVFRALGRHQPTLLIPSRSGEHLPMELNSHPHRLPTALLRVSRARGARARPSFHRMYLEPMTVNWSFQRQGRARQNRPRTPAATDGHSATGCSKLPKAGPRRSYSNSRGIPGCGMANLTPSCQSVLKPRIWHAF